MGCATATELPGMPEPCALERLVAGGETFITRGPYLVCRFGSDDIGMRNLAVVALTDAGHPGIEVAACFAITPVYVSMLRGRARLQGSAGLVRQRGPRPKLSPAQVSSARRWSGQGVSNVEIATRLNVHARTVGRALEGGGAEGEQGSLEGVGAGGDAVASPPPGEAQASADDRVPAAPEEAARATDWRGPVPTASPTAYTPGTVVSLVVGSLVTTRACARRSSSQPKSSARAERWLWGGT